ncbi:MAG: molybdopterin-binding protein [Rickettsiales bacterium]
MSESRSPTAAVLLIGNELLSGRTQDLNLRHIAVSLATIGVRLQECRVVPDVEGRIVDALNALRAAYDYVFTTGGIGPTHDDVTAACVAKAFGRTLETHPDALRALIEEYGGEENLNEGRRRMAIFPKGAGLIRNSASGAPGFFVENVFVMAGIPRIMRAMLDAALPLLERGDPVLSAEVRVTKAESLFAEELTRIQEEFAPHVDLGSYPATKDGEKFATIVVRGVDAALVEKAAEEVRKRIATIS